MTSGWPARDAGRKMTLLLSAPRGATVRQTSPPASLLASRVLCCSSGGRPLPQRAPDELVSDAADAVHDADAADAYRDAP